MFSASVCVSSARLNYFSRRPVASKMDTISNGTRIYFRARTPNPLFAEWLQYWLDEAERKDSMKKHALAKALESLQKYPLVLYSGRDCAILDGFGGSICAMIDKQLNVYNAGNPGKLLSAHQMDVREKSVIFDAQSALKEKRTKPNPIGDFHKLDDTLEAMLNEASGFDDLAHRVMDDLDRPAAAQWQPDRQILAAGSFKIVLLVDTQETVGKSKRSLDAVLQALSANKVDFEVRRLSVGDFMWICRDERATDVELVLPYIVERKRMDDLASSIKDGRFHEQKFRLTNSGLPNKIYLIENRGNNQHIGLPLANLLQAATNTQVYNGFTVKFTESSADSMHYLSIMSTLLNRIYASKDLEAAAKQEIEHLPDRYYDSITSGAANVKLMRFDEFAETTGKMKHFTIRDMFVRQLVSLKSLSVEKALAIVEQYPSPQSLFQAYARCFGESEAVELLSNVRSGKLKRPLGSTISKIIYDFYNLGSYS